MLLRNPSVPVNIPIDGRLVPGSKITVIGRPFEDPQCIRINLKFGSGAVKNEDEIALHLSIGFYGDPVVVRNVWTSAGWGIEERDQSFFPFVPEQTYKIQILCERARYRIFIDDKQYCVFTHRLPLEYVCHLEVTGDTALSYVEVHTNDFTTPKGS